MIIIIIIETFPEEGLSHSKVLFMRVLLFDEEGTTFEFLILSRDQKGYPVLNFSETFFSIYSYL